MAVFYDPFWARVVFGSILGGAVLLAWLSKNEALQKTGLWLVLDWALASLAYEIMTAQLAPWVTPSLSALICVPMGNLAIKHRSYPIWGVVGLMVASLAVSVAFFTLHLQGGGLYYYCLNVLFVLRAVVLGGAGALAYWALGRRTRARPRAVG